MYFVLLNGFKCFFAVEHAESWQIFYFELPDQKQEAHNAVWKWVKMSKEETLP